MTETIHAARSPEFLSRLYDGELDASERAAFEAHRSRCEECRRASDAFAATLAAFRSSPTAPPAVDLSARILRKIRAQSPSRRPFGVMFGIDVRWAGIFVAALLVVLLSAPLLLRRQGPVPASPSAINAHILDATATTGAAKERPVSAPPPPAAPAEAPAPPAPADRADRSEVAARLAPAAEAPADDEAKRFASQGAEAKAVAPALRRRASSLESRGTERGAANVADASASPPRLTVRRADDGGPAPGVVSRPDDEQLAPLRGQEFLVVVDPGGRVQEVQPSAGKDHLSRTEAAEAGVPGSARPSDALLALRFAPGDRPRRLFVLIE